MGVIIFLLLQNAVIAIALLAVQLPNPKDYGNILEPPSSIAIIACLVKNVSSADSFTTRWFANATTELHNSDKYITSQGIQAETEDIVTLLVIQNLSYEDAANYTCVVSPKLPLLLGAQQSFVTQQLSLPVKLDILNGPVVTANIGDPSPAMLTLQCEMYQYIRPDSSLLWYHNNDGPLTTGSKYDVEYSSGTRQTQIGTNETTRISVLAISNVTLDDLGNYTCRVGEEKATVLLIGNAPARISKLNGNKSSFRIGKGTFEHQDNEQATAAAAAIRSGSLPALVTIYLILHYVML